RVRTFVKLFRHYIWLRDPFAHNHLLDAVLAHPGHPDLVVANGDFSCDSGFIGVSEPAAQQSAREALQKLRHRFGPAFHATFGDHELGKRSLDGKSGGLRLASFDAAQSELGLEPFWTKRIGRYLLIGVTSTLIAFPVYAPEALAEEIEGWKRLREKHLAQIAAVFSTLEKNDRALLFCHDPTALPYLWELPEVQAAAPRIEKTIIGHLHTQLIWTKSLLLAGMPSISFMGGSIRRMSRALHRARDWRPFKVLLCPSLTGSELLKDGGYYTARLDPSGIDPAVFRFHPLPR
ncbi:MAG TPA: hypothetical protein VEH27_08595, partial [Methylomirabilota bacterium]|nr:hypothetical protein [Methylomirabilota bacterium]